MTKRIVLIFTIPLLIFFALNMLTPVWWDDFIMACHFDTWYVPHTALTSSFSDVFNSTVNMYCTWHGRSVVDFLNFLFLSTQNKMIFNVCNTLVYGMFIVLMCSHVTGSFRFLYPSLFLALHLLLWLFLPGWGQNMLWLTGSLNYLWSGTLMLLFLVPFRRRMDTPGYALSLPLSVLWLFIGVIAAWTMENSASGIIILLLAYFAYNFRRRFGIRLFEALGFAGFAFGFYMLVTARSQLFQGFYILFLNFLEVGKCFARNSGLLVVFIIAVSLYSIKIKRHAVPCSAIFFFVAGMASTFVVAIPGKFYPRIWFMPQTFFLLSLLILVFDLRSRFSKRMFRVAFVLLGVAFTLSFILGVKSITDGYLLTASREQYIQEQKSRGILDVAVKAPVEGTDSHSGLCGGIDVLPPPVTPHDDSEFVAHNSAKATWFGLHSIYSEQAHASRMYVIRMVHQWWTLRDGHPLSKTSLLRMIYAGW